MEKTVIMVILAAGCVLCARQYFSNKEWEDLLINKQKGFNTTRTIRRKSLQYRNAAAACFVLMAGTMILPQNLVPNKAGGNGSMDAHIVIDDSAAIEEAVETPQSKTNGAEPAEIPAESESFADKGETFRSATRTVLITGEAESAEGAEEVETFIQEGKEYRLLKLADQYYLETEEALYLVDIIE